MGILILLAVLTGISVSRVSREARLSSGVNQVIAALGTARSVAIQSNSTVMVTFTVNVDRAQLGDGELVEIVLARASGEITTRYGSTRTAQRGSRMLKELNLVGSDAQAITAAKWYQGDAPNVESGVSMVVFWEKWCPHCRREMPELEATYKKYGDRMSFVGLTKQSKNTSDEDVQSFIDENSLTYPIGKEDGSISNAYAVSGIPAAAVVKDGKVVWRGHPGSLSDDMLDGWLN